MANPRRRVAVGEQRAPHRVRVQHGARAASADDLDVEPRFRRRPAGSGSRYGAVGIDLQDLVGGEIALRQAAGRDRQAKRVAIEDRAEIAARAEHPAARIEPPANLDQVLRYLLELGHEIRSVSGSGVTLTGGQEFRSFPILPMVTPLSAPPSDPRARRAARADTPRWPPPSPERAPPCQYRGIDGLQTEQQTRDLTGREPRNRERPTGTPMAMPISTSSSASRTTSHTTSPRRAPSAMRIPISLVR